MNAVDEKYEHHCKYATLRADGSARLPHLRNSRCARRWCTCWPGIWRCALCSLLQHVRWKSSGRWVRTWGCYHEFSGLWERDPIFTVNQTGRGHFHHCDPGKTAPPNGRAGLFFLKKWISQRHDQQHHIATNLYYLGQTFLPRCCEWLLRLRVHLGKRDHPRGKKSFPQSPCSAPAQPCHHCSHWFPQQGGGAPVPEQGLFCPQDLYCGRRVLGQVCETPGVRDQTSSNLKSRANLASARHSTHEIRYKRTIHKHMRTISTGFCVITMAQWIDRFWYNIIGPRF